MTTLATMTQADFINALNQYEIDHEYQGSIWQDLIINSQTELGEVDIVNCPDTNDVIKFVGTDECIICHPETGEWQ